MKYVLSCVTLSKEPKTWDHIVNDCHYYNHVSTITSLEELHSQRLKSLENIITPYFFFQDSDDPMPDVVTLPSQGIAYGNLVIDNLDLGKKTVLNNQNWNAQWHLANPYAIRKAYCNTQHAKLICKHLPKGEYWTELLLYYFLAKLFGSTYDPIIEIIWRKQTIGFHTQAQVSVINSVMWIMNNEKFICQNIEREMKNAIL